MPFDTPVVWTEERTNLLLSGFPAAAQEAAKQAIRDGIPITVERALHRPGRLLINGAVVAEDNWANLRRRDLPYEDVFGYLVRDPCI